MSHLVSIKTQIRDLAALQAACTRLNLEQPKLGDHTLFGSKQEGYGVQLPGWKFLLVCDLASGNVFYDNFNGSWGKQAELDRFQQAYAVCKVAIECRKKGQNVVEALQADGSIRLTIAA